MSGPYQTLRDHVSIQYDGSSYWIALTKEITPTGPRPVTCLYGRIWPMLFPDDPVLAGQHADHYPVDVAAIDLHCSDSDGRTLSYDVNHRYGHYVEIIIPFRDSKEGIQSPLHEGERRAITYSFSMTHKQWGPHIERRLVRSTTLFSIDLDFPAQLVDISSYIISGDTKLPLFPAPTYTSDGRRELWHWERRDPEWDDRYRLSWRFKDGRESAVRSEFLAFLRKKSAADELFRINERDRVLVWKGSSYKISDLQMACLKYMHKNFLEGNEMLHQKTIIASAKSNSERLRDIFKHSKLYDTLIKPRGGGYFCLDIEEK